MFNKKLINVLAYVLLVMLLVKLVVLDLVLGIWSFFTLPEWIQQNMYIGRVVNMLTSIGGVIFIYIVVAAVRNMAMGPSAPRPPMPFVKRPAPIHHPAKK